MRIEKINSDIYAAKYPGQKQNEFGRLIKCWKDPEYLEQFFEDNIEDFNSGFYNDISIEDAIFETIEEASAFEQKVLQLAKGKDIKGLESLFKPLSEIQKEIPYGNRKAYGTRRKSWLRLYAVKVPENGYLITGGAIKLTKKMEVREHTTKELKKMDQCKAFLKSKGVFDQDGLLDFELEL
ncbi:hypothetical protein [Pedobacter nutrimenti]|uniref:hypothetical protein n=1 Tax=Pedobacter nutrimenti TaxID=1241337 RepID=UPI00292EF8CD|nr:hypothetical protein [Pedobacter nutrimenti]